MRALGTGNCRRLGVSVVVAVFACCSVSLDGAWAGGGRSVSVRYDFPAPQIKVIGGYAHVSVRGCLTYQKVGAPILPFRTARVLLPPGHGLDGGALTSLQEPQVLDLTRPLAFGRTPLPLGIDDHPAVKRAAGDKADLAIYSSDTPYPAKPVEVISTQRMSGYDIAVLRIFPAQYVPSEQHLLFSPQVTLELTLAPRQAKADMRNMLPRSAVQSAAVAAFVDNPGGLKEYGARQSAKTATCDYLLITREALIDSFRPLLDKRTADGLVTKTESVEHILTNVPGIDEAEKVRNYIRDAYVDEGLTYVLLGGDIATVPYRQAYAYCIEEDNTMPCDLYFSCLDGSWNRDGDNRWGEPTDGDDGGDVDLLGEVYVARAPVDTVGEVGIFVNKIVGYEQRPHPNPYQARLLGEYLGYYDPPGVHTQGGDGLDYLLPHFGDYTQLWLDDRPANGPTWGRDECLQALNLSPHIVAHDGHSNETYLMRMNSSDIDSLTNADPFLIATSGCNSAAFDHEDSFGEDLLKRSSQGAFAAHMGSRYGWFNIYEEWKYSGEFAEAFFDRLITQKERSIGAAYQLGKHDLIGSVETSGDMVYRWVYFSVTLLGDPAAALQTLPAPVLGAEPLVTAGTSNTINWNPVSPLKSASGKAAARRGPSLGHATQPRLDATPIRAERRAPSSAAMSLSAPPMKREDPPSDKASVIDRETASRSAARSATKAGWQTIKSEDFDGAWPNDWVLDYNYTYQGNPITWGTATFQHQSGPNAAWPHASVIDPAVYWMFTANSGSVIRSWMIYGPINLSDATAAEVTFSLKYELGPGDSVAWLASTDGASYYGRGLTGGSQWSWHDREFDLSDVYVLGDLCGQSEVYLAFLFRADDQQDYVEGAYIDDVKIQKYVAGDPADLTLAETEVPSDTVVERHPCSLKARISNDGAGTADASHVMLYLSPANDADLDDDTYIGEQPVGSLGPGDSEWVEWSFGMPDLGPGSYSAWPVFVVDCRDEVPESSEDNAYIGDPFSAQDAPVVYYAECSNDPDFVAPTGSDWISDIGHTFNGLIAGQQYWYRVKAAIGPPENRLESAWSNVESSVQGTLTVTTPNGAEVWGTGTQQDITWDTSIPDPGTLKIELCQNGLPVSAPTDLPDAAPADAGLYRWSIPSNLVPGTDYRVRITSNDEPDVSDESDECFAISTMQHTLTVESTPMAGVSITGTSSGVTPYSAPIPTDSTVDLYAPGTYVDGAASYRFLRWSVDGADRPEGETHLTLEASGDTTAVAAYIQQSARTLSLSDDLKLDPQVRPRATVALAISDALDVRGARLAVGIDPGLEYVSDSVDASGSLTGSWQWIINDTDPRRLVMSGAGAESLPAGGGILIRFDVELASPHSVSCGDEVPLPFDTSLTRLNDGQIPCGTESGLVTINCPPSVTITSPDDGYVHPDPEAQLCFTSEADDPDNDLPLVYQWDFGGGADPSGQQNPCVTFVAPGTYVVTLTVTDAIGRSSADSIAVRINAPPNGVILTPSQDITINLGKEDEATVVFTADGNDPDDDTPLTYHWDFDGAAPSADEQNPAPVKFCWSGAYQVTLTVTDALGLSDSTPATVTVDAIFRWGDANNDDVVGTLDASQILAWDALLFDCWEEWPCSYCRPEYPEAADVNGDGLAGVTDASSILEYDSGRIAYLPADTNQDGWGPDDSAAAIMAAGEEPGPPRAITVEAAPNDANTGEEAEVSVLLDDASGVSGFRLAVNLDRALEYVPESATVQSTLFDGAAQIVVNAEAPGRLVVSGAGLKTLEAGRGAILRFRVRVKPGTAKSTPLGLQLDLDESLTRLNDGQIPAVSLDGAISAAITPEHPAHGALLPDELGAFLWKASKGVKARRIEFGSEVREDGRLRPRYRARLSRGQTSWTPDPKACRTLRRLADRDTGRLFWQVVGRGRHARKISSAVRSFRFATVALPHYTIREVTYRDHNENGKVDLGDEVAVQLVHPEDAAQLLLGDLMLPVQGDSFGEGARLHVRDDAAAVVLGQNPWLTVDGAFRVDRCDPDSASGLAIAADALNLLVRPDEPRPDSVPHDIVAADPQR